MRKRFPDTLCQVHVKYNMENRYGLRKVRACDGERRIYLSVRKTKKPHDVGLKLSLEKEDAMLWFPSRVMKAAN